MERSTKLNTIIWKALGLIPLFSQLPADLTAELTDLASVAQFKKDTFIYRRGSASDQLYVILSGRVKVSRQDPKQERELTIVGPGGTLGEISLLDGAPWSADAQAVENTLVFFIPRKDFQQWLFNRPEAGLKLIEALGQSIREATDVTEFCPLTDSFKGVNSQEPGETSPAGQTLDNKLDELGLPCLEEVLAAEGSASASQGPTPEEQNKWIYPKKFTCPLCQQETTSQVPRTRYVQMEKEDSDMCATYRMVDPTFYSVVVCHYCGFAFLGDVLNQKINKTTLQILVEKMPSIKPNHDFSGPRTMDEALATYLLAITCQSLAKSKDSVIGHLYHRLACFYRRKGQKEEEMKYLEEALKHIQAAFAKESSTDPRNELRLMYLIGDLHARHGLLSEAIQWFSRVINHPGRSTNPYIVNKAQDRWQEIRMEEQDKKPEKE